jgi:hypothetical protein
MAQFNENITLAAPNPLDKRYLSNRILGGSQLPYSGVSEVYSTIPSTVRYSGLTVFINTGGTNIEYWFKNNITTLIQKKYDTILPISSFVTGATNIGYFSGHTSIQTLAISTSSGIAGNYLDYSGNYSSLYNYYYRGVDQKIHIGTSNDGIPKRGYVKTALPIESWIWNQYTGGSGNMLGWIFVIGDISLQIGQPVTGVIYYTGSSQVYTQTAWSAPANNGGKADITSVFGSLTTGTTMSIGGPVFATKTNNILNFRTLISKTPNIIGISSDETFVYLSGSTGNQLITAANGLTKVGQTVKLGGTLTGTTTICKGAGNTAGIEYGGDYSASFTDRSLIDKGYLSSISALGGERIFKTICQSSHGFSIGQVVGFSGCTYNKPIATGSYDGEVIGIVTNCFNSNSFEVTQAGFVSGITVGGGLVTNCTYFLSATVAGCLTTCEPTTPNYLSKSMLIATSSCSGWVLPYAGYVITSGITQGGALIRNVCNISASPYVVTPSDFYIGAKGGDIVQLVSNVNGQVIVVDDVCGNAAIGCEIQVSGVFFGGSSTACINTAFGSMTFIYNGGKTKWSAIGFSTAPY